MNSCLAIRLGAALVVAVLAGSGVAPPAEAAPDEPSSTAASTPAVVSGQVNLDEGASATRDATVTVAVVPPTGPASRLRVSNDGGSTWVERTYATSFTWSLVDPAAGGTDEDGKKIVTVEAGDGVVPWASLGADGILLDRTGPIINDTSYFTSGWETVLEVSVTDGGSGVSRREVSLDGVHWRAAAPAPWVGFPAWWVDFREGSIGGSWASGEREYFLRALDRLGNAAVLSRTMTVTPSPGVYDIPRVQAVSTPLPAISGELFTIAPVWGTWRIPSGYHCFWRLEWGSAATMHGGFADEDYGSVALPRAPRNGICDPWTFTLPYSPGGVYRWGLSIVTNANRGVGHFYGPSTTFRGESRSTSRAMTTSTFAAFYLLPDGDVVPAAGEVTYRVRSTTGSAAPSGWWACRPADSSLGVEPQSKFGGSVFSCRPTTSGPWVAEWTYEDDHGSTWRAEYDPVSDRSKPTVTTPIVRVGSVASPSPTYPPVSISWSGHDAGTGIFRYSFQRSVDGGPYLGISLASARATGIDLRLGAGRTYRFRVRAKDRAGNWSTWSYSAPVRASLYEETSSAFAWSSGWTRRAAPGASGGAVRDATAAGRSATFRFSGRAVGWFARKGPGNGFAQVRVDGILVATVSLESATAQPPRVLWRKSWATTSAHAVVVRLLGTAGRPRVEVDAFEVLR